MEFLKYVGTLLTPFFRWWWALITGVATLFSFFAWRTTELNLSGIQAALAVLIFFSMLFLVLSVISQGYKWYIRSYCNPEVIKFSPAANDSETEIFHLKSLLPLEPGQVVSVLRTFDDGRVICMGMLKVERLLSDRYQCIPLWIGPGHRQDLKRGKIKEKHLSTSLLLNESDLSRYIEEGTTT